VSYSYYTAADKNRVSAYDVPGHDGVLLAFPQHKLAMAGSLQLYRGLSLDPVGRDLRPAVRLHVGDASGTPMIGREGRRRSSNANLLYRNAFGMGSSLPRACSTSPTSAPTTLQPYNGGHPPLPGPGRELVFPRRVRTSAQTVANQIARIAQAAGGCISVTPRVCYLL